MYEQKRERGRDIVREKERVYSYTLFFLRARKRDCIGNWGRVGKGEFHKSDSEGEVERVSEAVNLSKRCLVMGERESE